MTHKPQQYMPDPQRDDKTRLVDELEKAMQRQPLVVMLDHKTVDRIINHLTREKG